MNYMLLTTSIYAITTSVTVTTNVLVYTLKSIITLFKLWVYYMDMIYSYNRTYKLSEYLMDEYICIIKLYNNILSLLINLVKMIKYNIRYH